MRVTHVFLGPFRFAKLGIFLENVPKSQSHFWTEMTKKINIRLVGFDSDFGDVLM